MRQPIHGGDIYSKTGIPEDKRIIDFSANINPLGMPFSVKKAIIDNIDNFSNYPDPLCRELTDALAEHENVSSGYIVCGNGAADIIYRIAAALKPEQVLLTAPTFSEYEQAAKTVNSRIYYHYLPEENNFRLNDSIFESIKPSIDILFLCNPNNPTGIPLKKEKVLEIAAYCKKNRTILVVDECFMDFLPDAEKYTVVHELVNYDNIIVLKAFTKIYAMAGIRLGYGICSNKQITEAVFYTGQPWSVSVIAQACGVSALREAGYVYDTREVIKSGREYLSANLRLLGFRVFDSKANFILIKTEDKNLSHKLQGYGILIRSCCNFKGLDDGYYRIAVKSEEDNRYLIKCLKDLYMVKL